MPAFTQFFSIQSGESVEGVFVNTVGPAIYASTTPGVASNVVDQWQIDSTGHLTQNGVQHTLDTDSVTAIYYHSHFLFQTSGGIWWYWTGGTTGNGQGWTPQPAPQTISMNSTTFVGTPKINTAVGVISVVAEDEQGVQPFTGTLSITGTDQSFFKLVGPQLTFATAGTVGKTSYSINLVATQNGVPFPPLSVAFTITQVAVTVVNYGTTPPNFILNVAGNTSPLGWTVANFDDFTSWTESSTAPTATTATMTWSVGRDQDFNNAYPYAGGTTSAQQVWLNTSDFSLTPYIFQATGPNGESGIINIQAWVPTAPEKTTVTSKNQWINGVTPIFNTAYTYGTPGTGSNTGLTGVNWIQFYAGALHQNNNQTFGPGYYELNMQVPKGVNGSSKGFWCAFYLQSSDGEIDIYEQWGERNQWMHGQIIDPNTSAEYPISNQQTTGIDLTAGFHTFGCLWTPNYVAVYLDGSLQGSVPRATYGSGILNNSIMNLHIYQQFGATIDSTNYNLDWPPSDGWAIPAQFGTSRTTIASTSMRIDWFRYSRLGPA